MRLFHISEEKGLKLFAPRQPNRKDLEDFPPLVWAISEEMMPNFLTPRDCPRVTYYSTADTTKEDRGRFFSSPTSQHVVAIEHGWFHAMITTTLYLYEFDPAGFSLQDAVAGYYVSEEEQVPIAQKVITNIIGEQIRRGVELRILPEIISLGKAVQQSTLGWSLCHMDGAREQ